MNWFDPTSSQDGFRELLHLASWFYVRLYGLLVIALIAGSGLCYGWRFLRRAESDGR